MTVYELHELLTRELGKGNGLKEIRLGDQIESGQYLHASVGGVYEGTRLDVILCANDDEQWFDEGVQITESQTLKALWEPPKDPAGGGA